MRLYLKVVFVLVKKYFLLYMLTINKDIICWITRINLHTNRERFLLGGTLYKIDTTC